MAVPWFVVLVLTATALGASVTPEKQVLEKSTCGRVWLTVHSPEIKVPNKTNIVDALELNWDFAGCSDVPMLIGLFEERPSSWRTALKTYEIKVASGHVTTNVSLGEEKLPAGWQTQAGQKGPHCLWPWIGAGDEHINAYNCLKIQPTWMEDNIYKSLATYHFSKVGHLQIGELVIPGTHNAGAWRFHTEISTVTRDSFVLCQDRSVWAQLVHGIRYLEFSISYYEFYPKEEDSESIGHLQIGELVIPGTHNAGAWRFNTEISTVTRDSFVLCQDRSVWAQLVHGIRYLDFRISYYEFYPKEEDRYWLNHNLIRVRPLVPLLREIRTFLDSTDEIVFLDAHHFPMGFYHTDGTPIKNVHAGLLELIQRELGPHLANGEELIATGARGPTVKSLIDSDKRLLFSYSDNSIVTANNWLWPLLPHLWANTNNPQELFLFLDEAMALSSQISARSPLHSVMAQTTPTVLDILFLRGNLRDNADAVNRNITMRLKRRWRHDANIVSTDFFLANDVIDVSIDINLERGKKL